MIIRPAQATDREAFHALARAYIGESGQRREYSELRTQQVLEQAVADREHALMLLAEVDGGLAGGVMAMLDHAFTVRPVCGVGMFYVRPEHRGTGLARALMEGAVAWADAANATHTFTSADAMLSSAETQMYINLTRKFGFEPTGSPVLARRKP